jgi:alkylhydroperoxidase family enzyme
MIKPLIPAACRLTAPGASAEILNEIQQSLGRVPHIFEAAAHSPAVLDLLWRQATSVSQMYLSAQLRRIVAERIAELHGYGSAVERGPTSSGKARELPDNPKERAVQALVTKIVKDQGHHAGFVVEAARQVGVTNAEIIEIISLIAFHTWAHYISSVANTELDLPSLLDEAQQCGSWESVGMLMQTETSNEEQET